MSGKGQPTPNAKNQNNPPANGATQDAAVAAAAAAAAGGGGAGTLGQGAGYSPFFREYSLLIE